MRIAGATLLFLSFLFYGLYSAFMLRLRVIKLESAITYINTLTEDMRLTRAELSAVLSRTAKDKIYIENGVWCGVTGLRSEDLKILSHFLLALGKTDIDGQIKNSEQSVLLLTKRLAAARTDSEKTRLYVSGYALAGLFLVVLVI